MYGFFANETPHGRLWLDRLLIDKKFQGKGYGKSALYQLINILFTKYNTSTIYLSVFDDNVFATNLYKSVGFKFTGELDLRGEKIMVYNKNN